MAKDAKDIVEEFNETKDAWDGNRESMADDLAFLEGGIEGQWPTDIASARESDGRPCLVINKLPSFLDQIEGDIRQNRPMIKVKPVDSSADRETARIFTGLIKNIEIQSSADVAYDTAVSGAAGAGMGAFRVITRYVSDESFDQEIRIKRIKNPFTVYPDPKADEITYEDGRWMFVTEKLSREKFTKMYPNADPCEFVSEKDAVKDWIEKAQIRVAEQFYREEQKKTLYLIQLTDMEPYATFELPKISENEYEVLQERKVQTNRLMWCKLTGKEIIEGPEEWPGNYYPIILVWGKELNVEGKTVYRGVVRHAKDPQRLYNYNRSMGAEYVALAPKAPYIGTAKQFENYEDVWKLSSKKNYPYLPYNADPQAQGPPQRSIPTMVNTGIQYEVQISDQELHDTMGLQQASLGERSNEKSGIAIAERRRQGDRGQFAYVDNLARSLKYAGKVLVDLIPKIYDTARIERIFNEDGTEEQVGINGAGTEGQQQIYALDVGKYDVTVTVGPSYETQRIEAADQMIQLTSAMPDVAPMIADLIVKNLDFPGAEEIQKRLQKLLPPGLAEGEGDTGAPGIPPPGGGPPPPPPDPTMEIKIAQEQEKLRKMKADADKAEIEVQISMSELTSGRMGQ